MNVATREEKPCRTKTKAYKHDKKELNKTKESQGKLAQKWLPKIYKAIAGVFCIHTENPEPSQKYLTVGRKAKRSSLPTGTSVIEPNVVQPKNISALPPASIFPQFHPAPILFFTRAESVGKGSILKQRKVSKGRNTRQA